MKPVVIIGAVAAGMSAASVIKRELPDQEVCVFGKEAYYLIRGMRDSLLCIWSDTGKGRTHCTASGRCDPQTRDPAQNPA